MLKWHHVAMVRNATANTLTVYIDGAGNTISDTTTDDFNMGVPYYIGNRSGAGSTVPAKAIIDQVRVYDYARTPAQIAWDYNKGAPVGHWKFNECQGAVANDSSGNSNTGTITVGALGTQTSVGTCTGSANTMWKDGATGKYNSSLDFDGTDDYVSTNYTQTSITAYTIAAWIKVPTSQTNADIIVQDRGPIGSGGRSITLGLDGNGACSTSYCISAKKPMIAAESDGIIVGIAGTTNLNDNTWHHIVGTWSAPSGTVVSPSQFALYVDGTQVPNPITKSTQPPTSPLTGSGGTLIGYHQAFNSYFNGQIDDVRIYNYALTPVQVKGLYNGGAVRFGPSSGTP